MLKNSQTLSLHQKLSPNIIQAQLLLALPSLALEQEIKQQLEDNPILEEDTLEPDAVKETEEIISEDTADKDEETYDIDDWYDYQETDDEGYKSPETYDKQSHMDFEARTDYFMNKNDKLRETPIDQLHRSGLDESSILIGEEIIGSLDDDGYLKDSLDDLREDISKQTG